MSIHERITPADIDPIQYELFLNNDLEIAPKYGFDKDIYNSKML